MSPSKSLQDLLQRAIAIAEQQHAGQVDKAGRPYIEHPNSDVTLDQLAAEGFPAYILDALDSVTRKEGETYEAFVARAATNAIGRRVKYADLQDNADLTRIAAPTAADLARAIKYQRAMAQLNAA